MEQTCGNSVVILIVPARQYDVVRLIYNILF